MFEMTIDTGNAAFADDADGPAVEVARMLRHASYQLERGDVELGVWRTMRDGNGNTCGRFRLTAESEG